MRQKTVRIHELPTDARILFISMLNVLDGVLRMTIMLSSLAIAMLAFMQRTEQTLVAVVLLVALIICVMTYAFYQLFRFLPSLRATPGYSRTTGTFYICILVLLSLTFIAVLIQPLTPKRRNPWWRGVWRGSQRDGEGALLCAAG